VKKLLAIPLKDEEVIELRRILMDKDPDGALEFLQTHAKGKARELLEGG
jgi:pyruvate-formate lyase-activating enzyme